MFINDLLTEDMHYIFNPLCLLNKEWRWNDEQFFQLPKNKLIVINCSSENWGEENFIGSLHTKLSECCLNFLILSHKPTDHLSNTEILFYPYWYHWSIKNFECIYQFNISIDRKRYTLSCLNRAPRPHRIYNYLTINKRDDMLFTMRNGNATRSDDLLIPTDLIQKWDDIRHTLKNELDDVNFPMVNDPAWVDSYISLVTETTISTPLFITEKTWKPIAVGQLFTVLGNPGTIAHLRGQGLDCFDDIIDHSYDLIENTIQRIESIHTSIDKLLDQDLYLINMVTKQRRQANAELFFSGQLYSNYDQDLKNKL